MVEAAPGRVPFWGRGERRYDDCASLPCRHVTVGTDTWSNRVNPFKPSPSLGRPSTPSTDDPMMDFRARLVHQQAEAAERRRLDLAEQSSRLKTAEERIRIWERIHEVTLPRDSAHRLIEIIAANTGLTDADVREEQQRRAALRAAV